MVAFNNLGLRYRYAQRYTDAEKAFLTAITLSPSAGGLYYELGVTHLLNNNPEAAAVAFGKEPISAFQKIGMAMVRHAEGNEADTNELLQDVIAEFGDQLSYYIAQVFAIRGNNDYAFEWLEKAILANDGEVTSSPVEPLLSGLHQDERWSPFLERIGRSPQKLSEVEFVVTLPH